MRKIITICLAILMMGGITQAQAPDLSQMDIVQRSVPDGPVAKVRDVNIASSDFLLLYQSELQRNRSQSIPDVARVQLGLMVLRSLIEQELLYQQAEINNLKISDKEVDTVLQSRLDSLVKGFSAQEGRDVTEAELFEEMGFNDKSALRKNVRRLLLVEAMRAKIIEEDGLGVDDAQVKEFYEKSKDQFVRPGTLHLKQIFISSDDQTEKGKEASQKKADKALATIFSGQRFEAVAKQFSDSPDASRGGDLGKIPEKELPPFLVAAAEGLMPGDVSDVAKSEYGYHIVMLVAREDGSSVSQEKAYEAIRRKLGAEQETTAVFSYCDDLIANGVEVKVYLELEDNLRRLGGLDALNVNN